MPKWPQCIIKGKPVTQEQALEIIRRTDMFFSGFDGNNEEFIKEARRVTHSECMDFYHFDNKKSWEEKQDEEDKFKEVWNLLETEYIQNHWISCFRVDGPNGWCHPDGTIEYHLNVGKWPNVEDIHRDLLDIAQAFPFVEMTVSLMDGEEDYCENTVVSFSVKDGHVEFIEPIPYSELMKDYPKKTEPDFTHLLDSLCGGTETAIPMDVMKKWGEQYLERLKKWKQEG